MLAEEAAVNLQEQIDAMNVRIGGLSFVNLTQAEYEALAVKDANTIYFTTE